MRTNTKIVGDQVKAHILEAMELEDIKGTIANIKWGLMSDYEAAKSMVMDGSFLIYYEDVNNFLNGLGINPEGKEYDNQKSWDLYIHLLASEIVKLIK